MQKKTKTSKASIRLYEDDMLIYLLKQTSLQTYLY